MAGLLMFVCVVMMQDEVDIVLGVLKIASKTVQDCMVPMEQVYTQQREREISKESAHRPTQHTEPPPYLG